MGHQLVPTGIAEIPIYSQHHKVLSREFALLNILTLSDFLFPLGLQPNEQQPVYRGLPVSAIANSLFDCNVSRCNMTCNGSFLLSIKLESLRLLLK